MYEYMYYQRFLEYCFKEGDSPLFEGKDLQVTSSIILQAF